MSKPLRHMRDKSTPKEDRVPVSNPQETARLAREGARYLQEGKTAEALSVLEEAHASDPQDYDVALNLSASYILSGSFRKALPILEDLRRRYPDRPQIWINLGAAYLGNPVLAGDEQQQQALVAFKHALSLDPGAVSVAYNIGLIYRDRRERDEAAYWFRQAIEHHPGDQHARNQLQRLLQEEQDS